MELDNFHLYSPAVAVWAHFIDCLEIPSFAEVLVFTYRVDWTVNVFSNYNFVTSIYWVSVCQLLLHLLSHWIYATGASQLPMR